MFDKYRAVNLQAFKDEVVKRGYTVTLETDGLVELVSVDDFLNIVTLLQRVRRPKGDVVVEAHHYVNDRTAAAASVTTRHDAKAFAGDLW